MQWWTVNERTEDYQKRVLQQLGRYLRQLRRKGGLTQAQLGEKAEVTRSYLAEIESGQHNPTLLMLWRICWALQRETPGETRHLDLPSVLARVETRASRARVKKKEE